MNEDAITAEAPFDAAQETCCVVDTGLFQHCAEHLAKSFKKVYLHNPAWKETFSSSKRLYVGDGIDNIELAEDVWDIIEDVGLFVFPDIQHGDMQDTLRKMGKRVWGSGVMGENLELDRWAFRQLLFDLDMPIAPAERIIGIDALRKYLEKVPEAYIKASKTRADWETYHHHNPYSTKLVLDSFQHEMGPMAEDYEFVVELPIETDVELGGDAPFVGAWPKFFEWGYERKDRGYAGTITPYTELPEPILYVNEKFKDVLAELNYRGSFSTEIRVKGKKFYFTDCTSRMGSPPSQLLWKMIGNWPERMWYGAEGKVVPPKVLAKYGFMVMVYDSECDTDVRWYGYPKKKADWYAFSFSCMIDGERYTLPQRCGMPFQCYVSAVDDDPKEAITKLISNCRELHGDGLDIRTESLIDMVNEIHIAEKMGYRFGKAKVPSVEEVARMIL